MGDSVKRDLARLGEDNESKGWGVKMAVKRDP